MQIRAENSRACPWWICSDGLPRGEQDPWAEESSCRMARCELRPAQPEERQMVVTRLTTLRTTEFCSRLSAGGLAMADRQLGIFENNASYVENGRRKYIWGNAPMNARLGGPVMYLYKHRMGWNNGQNIVHEAVHGLLNPNRLIPTYYADGATTELGLSIDQTARYCMGLRGR
jgi:hypothetical protein